MLLVVDMNITKYRNYFTLCTDFVIKKPEKLELSLARVLPSQNNF